MLGEGKLTVGDDCVGGTREGRDVVYLSFSVSLVYASPTRLSRKSDAEVKAGTRSKT